MALTLDGTKGETFPTWTTAGRPASPNAGQTGYNTTLNALETYNGSTWAMANLSGPSFRAYGSTNQTGLASGATTKIQLDTKTGTGGWDTASCFDATTNYRFTPNVAGYYLCNMAVYFTAGANNITAIKLMFYKNGSSYSIPVNLIGQVGATWGINGSDIIYFNGSTDYLEFYLYQTSNGTVTITAGSSSTWATATLMRAA